MHQVKYCIKKIKKQRIISIIVSMVIVVKSHRTLLKRNKVINFLEINENFITEKRAIFLTDSRVSKYNDELHNLKASSILSIKNK
jgi:hypothetical protein